MNQEDFKEHIRQEDNNIPELQSPFEQLWKLILRVKNNGTRVS
jgi:hypothetical protein